MSVEKKPVSRAAVMFFVDGKYYVMANRDEDPPKVAGFSSIERACSYFERAYHAAHETSQTLSAGAMLHFIQAQPRVFPFASIADLVALLGERVHACTLSGTAVHHVVFEVKGDADALALAKRLYDEGTSPRLI